MSNFDKQFLVLLLSVTVGFSCFILFLLKYRKKTFAKNLLLTSNDAWESIKERATSLGLDRSNLLYAIYQDLNSTEVKTILRNNKNEEVGETIKSIGNRKKNMILHGQKYVLTYPLTWKKEIILQKEGHQEILAKYTQSGWVGKHQIEIPNFGTIKSSSSSLDGKARYTYELNGKIIGMIEMTFNGYPKGRIAVLPDSIPLEVRLFILSN